MPRSGTACLDCAVSLAAKFGVLPIFQGHRLRPEAGSGHGRDLLLAAVDVIRVKWVLVQCGPWGMPGEGDYLFHSRGDGTFEDVSKKAGMDDPQHRYGLGAIWADYDNDGWPDLFVANDAGPNFLYHNRHDGTFDEVGMLAGVALGGDGQELGSMGGDFADYDHDGKLDLLVANYTHHINKLYRNLSAGALSGLSLPA